MEGAVPYLYQDVLGLVSIGVGILCDPIQLAMNLPMVHPDGRPADRAEIAAEWLRIKGLGKGDHTQGNQAARLGHRFAKPHTRLRLTDEGLRSTLAGKLHIHDVALRKRWPDFEEWPADAQLALHSWAWGVGPAARYPTMSAALLARDFAAAAEQVRMVANGVELHGLKPRNRANRMLLLNAAVVVADGLDPDVLYWPRDLSAAPVDKDADTQPEGVGPYRAEAEPAIVHAFPEIQRPPVDAFGDEDPDPEAA
jgi:GH24 family phage-related lysozyme (muramidase)